MYNRILSKQLKQFNRSVLLLGPRQVGKSTLIKSLKPDLEINFADEQEYFLFQTELGELERRLSYINAKTIFIDEIQRIPKLLNTIQYLIDKNKKLKFYLTGSSARKLRKGNANLLPGRVITYNLSALCAEEMGSDWNESRALRFGMLPGIQNLGSEKEKILLLKSYASTYLKEEILAESLVRQVDGFVRFLSAAALSAAEFLDYSKLSKKSKIPRQSVVRHFEILEDTMIVQKIENDPDIDNIDLVKHPRFYFFDLGVLNALRGSFELNKEREGFLYEHLVYNQLINTANAKQKDLKIYNFRTRGGFEVDFVLNLEGDKFAIECKSTESIASDDLKSLKRLDLYYKKINKVLIYRGNRELKEDGIYILPLRKALKHIGL